MLVTDVRTRVRLFEQHVEDLIKLSASPSEDNKLAISEGDFNNLVTTILLQQPTQRQRQTVAPTPEEFARWACESMDYFGLPGGEAK